ncbi:DUF4350 domain-containing protein [Christiangramia crocea]|uniref:DUF4350 domain-containing protein n=1 Tax=Christiangramia crocea TaxID=2904124 RepID=A0A9X1UYK3_9FLAO|nr:DUF4350 domain-containing protein [Gramella crocea]MCG9972717.1 DUF4350 domain-containing protein [Gramella crocea]
MNRTYKIAFGLFLFLVISLAWLESSEPEPINWNPSYTAGDKIPLGSFVFYENLKDRFPDSIQKINIPPYEYLNGNATNGTYFFLNNQVQFDKDELEDLLDWVAQGNRLFISSYGFGENLEDTLNISLSSFMSADDFQSRPALNFVNPKLKFEKDVEFDQDLPALYFNKIDTSKHVILGTSTFGKNKPQEKVNFIKSDFGDGEIYLHSTPQVFSNYFLLKELNYSYAENLLAYLTGNNLLWDAYYKSGKSFFTSPLYIFMNNRSLKWSYYFVIIAAILFILFEGKRKQRAIPVVSPLKNKSFEYTETLSQLYLEKKKFHELGLKKIALFMEYIRTNLRLDTSNLDEEFYKSLSAKTENSIENTRTLFERIINFQNNHENDKDEFFELSKSINSFKNKNGKSRSES